ncbi:VanZ family protein [Streptomyces sp. RTd22]|uniref:VanZ family protein n=1 Tax=Streptomyces sp. RTd22 TaxID=1841249 RepID=UPI0007C55EF1|nr:VanZ family protein [Streptomyces sp. RTd22]
MAAAHLLPIQTAAALFPLLALLLLLPTAVVLYRRHGVLSHGRALSLYGFLFYGITAFCMTIVPLPKDASSTCIRFAAAAHPQWLPGNTFGDIWKEAGHQLTLGALVFQNPAVAGALFNLLLTLPLGLFLRYHFRLGLRPTAAIGFGTALFFEVTQVTGVWGMYNCPYRLFDVDDLIINTSGAALGWLLAGPLARLLPALERLDGRALVRRPVPFGRRLAALVVDLAGYALATVFASFVLTARDTALPAWLLLVGIFAAWFVLVPLATGATPGKWLLRLRLVATDGGPLVAWRLVLRALLMGAFVLPLLAALFLAVLIVLDEPWPGDLFGLAHDPGAQGAEAVFTTLGPVQLLAVAAGFALTITCALETLRHPDLLGPHDHASGIRNAALPHSRAAVADDDEQPPVPDPVRTPEAASGAR